MKWSLVDAGGQESEFAPVRDPAESNYEPAVPFSRITLQHRLPFTPFIDEDEMRKKKKRKGKPEDEKEV
ncbi:hypothetical protein MRX96_015736 [Rhipicephalus microplus]